MVLYIMAAVHPELTGSRTYDIRMNKSQIPFFRDKRRNFFDLPCPQTVNIYGGKGSVKVF